MTICSPSTGHIALGLHPRTISPASGEQFIMSPSLKDKVYNIHSPRYISKWPHALVLMKRFPGEIYTRVCKVNAMYVKD